MKTQYAICPQRSFLKCLFCVIHFPGSGQIEFTEFVILASKFIVEEDEEALQKELKEAFRLYDKEGKSYNTCMQEVFA